MLLAKHKVGSSTLLTRSIFLASGFLGGFFISGAFEASVKLGRGSIIQFCRHYQRVTARLGNQKQKRHDGHN
jgi:hypothetical protein